MKIFGSVLILILAAFLGLGLYQQSLLSCEVPLGYRIGTLDPRFGITPEELQPLLASAENVWEEAAGKNLLEYDEEAMLPVDFVFDERQERTLASKNLDTRLQDLETTQRELEEEFHTLSTLYEEKLEEYRSLSAEYQSQVRNFNEKVAYWNSRGGAPEDEYEEIKDEEAQLKDIADELEVRYERLLEYAKEGDTLAEKDAALVERYNSEIATFEEKYGEAREFDQGIYTGDRITIYQFEEEADLVLALAHEFGHALLIEHTQDPASLMYPLLEKQDLTDPAPTAEDLAALDQACAERKNLLLRKLRTLIAAFPI